jgi:hypothetical protein
MLSLNDSVGSVPHYALFVVPSRDHHELLLAVRRGEYVGLPIALIERGKSLSQILRNAVHDIAYMGSVDPTLAEAPDETFDHEWSGAPARFSIFAPHAVHAVRRLGSGMFVGRCVPTEDYRRIGVPDFTFGHIPTPRAALAIA